MAAKKIFKPGQTASGILDSKGGDKLKQMRQTPITTLNLFQKTRLFQMKKIKIIPKTILKHSVNQLL